MSTPQTKHIKTDTNQVLKHCFVLIKNLDFFAHLAWSPKDFGCVNSNNAIQTNLIRRFGTGNYCEIKHKRVLTIAFIFMGIGKLSITIIWRKMPKSTMSDNSFSLKYPVDFTQSVKGLKIRYLLSTIDFSTQQQIAFYSSNFCVNWKMVRVKK